MNKDTLADSIAFLTRLSRKLNLEPGPRLPQYISQNATHMACDILHRFCTNLPQNKVHEYDWHLVGLSCFQIAAKMTSWHFGGQCQASAYLSYMQPPPRHIFAKEEMLEWPPAMGESKQSPGSCHKMPM